eukprot:Hpha_TRINITY_DN15581_c1_g3::TRINITY_DN15581_c1_g3_i5::g.104274::m.104274
MGYLYLLFFLVAQWVNQAVAVGSAGRCCSLCKMKVVAGNCFAHGGCVSCWKNTSFCSKDQTRCVSQCKATWCTGADPSEDPPLMQKPLLPEGPGERLWNHTDIPLRAAVKVSGSSVFVVPNAGLMLPPVAPH